MRLPIAFAISVALTGVTAAHEFKTGDLVIDHPWSRTTPSGARTGAGYVTVTNNGTETDRLVGGSAEISEGFELHTSVIVDSVAKMRPLTNGLTIPAGATVTLEPGGTHAMLTGIKEPIQKGKPFAGTLVFERAGEVPIEFMVEGFGVRPEAAADAHGGHQP
ncbi:MULTISPECIES: copper chaperone PCu(A)C [Aurantimonadaceae]|jgi:periplasmic copper chaperone A|uniref:Copper chaperone PCu(A)C n=2 Tax=Jiella TaxID=1775688 RepID=A0A6N9TD39_9HYPH|nr:MULTISPECIES: copper chaperone PCu(A)C [Aurantimonadaceae]MAU95475.1 copper chaperone PCu(A)C [Fulvimarina sp.]NDW06788.1 copper chaperone PCu(A)C [Jiella pacifica]ORE96975.1 hypothetical protein ATO4_10759 [Aurantimonas sp. 22II-16-19i]WAP71445.1 copper chaperone PCu(A)C [Jiella pelagia]|tara:strand:+ start:355 stop:840 length:486 start_codon:yes stop_codon:yes gene_type:complete